MEGGHLLFSKIVDADQAQPDGIPVVTEGMRSLLPTGDIDVVIQVAAAFDRAVQGGDNQLIFTVGKGRLAVEDDKVVADIGPASLEMPLPNFTGTSPERVRTMDDDVFDTTQWMPLLRYKQRITRPQEGVLSSA